MIDPKVELSFDNQPQHYQPGETLAGKYQILGLEPREIRAVELSVLWYTEGTGDEDLAVHFFERTEPGSTLLFDFRQPRSFATVLPVTPLSYAGVIVKICWCARVRVFLHRGKDLFAEALFHLGNVPPPAEFVA